MKKTPSELISFLREQGLSQKIIADKVGVTQATISRLGRNIHSDTNSRTKEKLEEIVLQFQIIKNSTFKND